jgi:uncharacterized protein YjiS (DUF1127 family)
MSSACAPAPRTSRLRLLAEEARAAWQAFLLRRKERGAARLLDGSSDYMLTDMGLSRGEIAGTFSRLAPDARRDEVRATRQRAFNG